MPRKALPQRAVGDEDPDYSPMDPNEEAEIKMIKKKIKETASRAHSTDQSKPPAAKGKRGKTAR